MKALLFVLSLVGILHATQGNLSSSANEAVQDLIRGYGYKCDTLDFAMRSSWDGSIRATCNNASYVYELKDVGGNWTVKVK